MMRSRHVILILSAIIANLAATPSRAGTIFGRIAPRSPRIFVDRSGTPLPLTAGNFSAHAGANVGGTYINMGGRWVLTGGTTDSQHVPVQSGAANTTFPADYIQVEPNTVKYAPAKPLGITYASIAKDVDGEPNGAMASVHGPRHDCVGEHHRLVPVGSGQSIHVRPHAFDRHRDPAGGGSGRDRRQHDLRPAVHSPGHQG